MRKARKAEEQQQKARDAKQWRDKSLQEGRKKVIRSALQPKAGGGKPAPAAGAAPGGNQQQQQQKGQQQGQQQQQQQQNGGGKGGKRQREEEGGLTFNKLDFGTGASCWRSLLWLWCLPYRCGCCWGAVASGPPPHVLMSKVPAAAAKPGYVGLRGSMQWRT